MSIPTSTSLPRGFRVPSLEDTLTTPEPSLAPSPSTPNKQDSYPSGTMDQSPPSVTAAPRTQRLRVKRRNPSDVLAAPTSQFLSSIARADEMNTESHADVPIPSIELPDIQTSYTVDETARLLGSPLEPDHNRLGEYLVAARVRARREEAPRTPAPEDNTRSLSPSQYPDWSLHATVSDSDQSDDDDSSRPSSAHSNQTNSSFFSRSTVLSDDNNSCPSPMESTEFPCDCSDKTMTQKPPSSQTARALGRARKAPWTPAMNQHLWSVYVKYRNDPKVTPVRIDKSGIPPPGVCLRVAREAQRSWRGALQVKQTMTTTTPTSARTPTSATAPVSPSTTFIQWPHTRAATRAHLRELCRSYAASRAGSSLHSLPRTPAPPFGRLLARHRNRVTTPMPTSPRGNGFSDDMVYSLVLSTADCLKPDAPIARITSGTFIPPTENTDADGLSDHGNAHVGSDEDAHGPTPLPSFHFPMQTSAHQTSPVDGPTSTHSQLSSPALLPGFPGTTPPPPTLHPSSGSGGKLQSPVKLNRSRSNTSSALQPRARGGGAAMGASQTLGRGGGLPPMTGHNRSRSVHANVVHGHARHQSITHVQKRRNEPATQGRRSRRPSLTSEMLADPLFLATGDGSSTTTTVHGDDGAAAWMAHRPKLDQLYIPGDESGQDGTYEGSRAHTSKSPHLEAPFQFSPGGGLYPPHSRRSPTLAYGLGGPNGPGPESQGHPMSFSFPSRVAHGSVKPFAEAALRPFATQRGGHAAGDEARTPVEKPDLATRLAYLESRLKDFRQPHDM